jgi:HEPN domain-containing protein
VNRLVFQELAETRLLDARACFEAGRYDAAYYLAGYTVECALKACIARQTHENDFPPKNAGEYYVHNLEKLANLATSVPFQADREADPALSEYWIVVKEWSEASRYQPPGDESARKAEEILRAVSDEQHEVLKCLSKYW